MFINYLFVAFRNLWRQKGYSLLNIAGLAIGIAGCMIILSYVRDDLRWDSFHENYDRIYRVVQIQSFGGMEPQHVSYNQNALTDVLIQDIPEVELASRYWPIGIRLVQTDRGEPGEFLRNIYLVDSTFFEMFSYELKYGDIHTAMQQEGGIVISEKASTQLFGDVNPVGRELFVDREITAIVAGVVAEQQTGSHQFFTILAPIHLWATPLQLDVSQWGGNHLTSYIMLHEGASHTEVEASLPEVISQYRDCTGIEWYLQPLREFHLHSSHIKYDMQINRSNISVVRTLMFIAIFVLLIACVNFINLSTARSIRRSREVGIRKVVGANRFNLILQFIGEAILIALFSTILAGVLVELVQPLFEQVADRTLSVNIFDGSFTTFSLLGLALLIGILAGAYPAFVLSAFKPAQVLKSEKINGKRGNLLRKGLVVFQFVISIVLLISTVFIQRQLHYALNRDLGYNREQVVVIYPRDDQLHEKVELIRTEFNRIAGISSVTIGSDYPVGSTSQWSFLNGSDEENRWLASVYSMDPYALETYQFELIAGRFFDENIESDRNWESNETAVVLNETAVNYLGWEDPVGHPFQLDSETTGIVIGVIRDFHPLPVSLETEPCVIMEHPEWKIIVSARVNVEDVSQTISAMESAWHEIYPSSPFEYRFLDQYFDALYTSETQLSSLVQVFTGLALFVAILGLFGLAAYSTSRRTREIGVRKVLGATILNIVQLINKEFAILVLIANVIAWPLAYILINQWLSQYVYRIPLSWWIFPLVGIVALLLASLTVGILALHAAKTNPVDSIRYE